MNPLALPSAALLLALAIGSAAASESCPAAFKFTPEPTAKSEISANHRFYLAIKGDGWYVGDSAFTSSGVPVVGDGSPAYTCPIAAGGHDTGKRSADVIDEYGNVLVTFKGKTIDKDVARLLAHPEAVIPDMRKQAAAVVTKARDTAKKDPKRAKAILGSVIQLKGWREGDDARALLSQLGG